MSWQSEFSGRWRQGQQQRWWKYGNKHSAAASASSAASHFTQPVSPSLRAGGVTLPPPWRVDSADLSLKPMLSPITKLRHLNNDFPFMKIYLLSKSCYSSAVCIIFNFLCRQLKERKTGTKSPGLPKHGGLRQWWHLVLKKRQHLAGCWERLDSKATGVTTQTARSSKVGSPGVDWAHSTDGTVSNLVLGFERSVLYQLLALRAPGFSQPWLETGQWRDV